MENIAPFVEFLVANDIEFSEKLEIKYSAARGYHVLLADSPSKRTTKIRQDEVLLRVPKGAVLSATSSCICNLIYDNDKYGDSDEDKIDQQAPPSSELARLVLAFIVESALREKSPWYAYLGMMPSQPEFSLRAFGPQSDADNDRARREDEEVRSWFKGTDVDDVARAAYEEISELYDTIAVPFYTSNEDVLRPLLSGSATDEVRITSKHTFMTAASIVGARCFDIDAFVGLGLCPVADLFNHAGTERDADVRFETAFEVCEMCGMHARCEHDTEINDDESMEQDDDDEEDGKVPKLINLVEDYVMVNASDDDSSDSVSDSGIPLIDTCDIVARHTISSKTRRGREIFNSYGPLPNAHLLVKYGFAFRGGKETNAHDYISLERDLRRIYREHDLRWSSIHSDKLAPEIKMNVDGCVSVDLWDRVVELHVRKAVSRAATKAEAAAVVAVVSHDALRVFNSAPEKLAGSLFSASSSSEAVRTLRTVVLTILELIARRWRIFTGGISSREYDFVIQDEAEAAKLPRHEQVKRFALIITANEKEILEHGRRRCERALGIEKSMK
ncbi:uncharacterized protein V1518DRAFT_376384 [Limtongia smithiae]|uniref:uncharacterized protein n=1 Tax=Limtongia smithiae TaxID=1125753 RepID=UPI0034CE95E9